MYSPIWAEFSFTKGVLERVFRLMRSDDFHEVRSGPTSILREHDLRHMEKTLSRIYRKVETVFQGCVKEFARFLGIIQNLRNIVYDIEDVLNTASTVHFEHEISTTTDDLPHLDLSSRLISLDGSLEQILYKLVVFSDSQSGFAPELDLSVARIQEKYQFLDPIGGSIVANCGNTAEHTWNQVNQNKASVGFRISSEKMVYELIQCFVASSIVLEGEKAISRDQIVQFWMAQGLLQSSEGSEDLRDIGDMFCDQLLSMGFLQLQNSGCPRQDIFRMHSKVQNFARTLLQGERRIVWDRDQISSDEEFPWGNPRKARTFLFRNHIGSISKPFLDKLISNLICARVILLDHSEFEELPETIGELKLLRYLSVAGNQKLQGLPESLCKIVKLETLDLSGCKQLKTLPKEMHKFVRMRHLLLSMKLTKVPQEVYSSLSSLHLFKICNFENLNVLLEDISKLGALRVLWIQDCPSLASLPNSIQLLTKLKEFCILDCQVLDLINWKGLVGLSGLEFLHFQGLPKLYKFPDGLKSASHSLQHLVVNKCENLTALPDCLQEFSNPLDIVIVGCPNIVTQSRVDGADKKAQQESKIEEGWCDIIPQSPVNETDNQAIQISGASACQEQHQGKKPKGSFLTKLGALFRSFTRAPAITTEKQKSQDDSTKYDIGHCTIFSLLTEDYEFEEQTLIQLWMAANFIPHESQGRSLFRTLFNNKLILPYGNSEYRLHIDAIKDAQKHNDSCLQWNNESHENNLINDSTRHISLVCKAFEDDTFEKLKGAKHLQTLLFLENYGNKISHILLDVLFWNLTELRILDLSRTDLEKVPNSVAHLTHLCYLDLSWTLIDWIPDMICNLPELQTLKLRGCENLHELPQSLKRLTKLRHLDLDILRELESMPQGIGGLTDLQTLSAFLVSPEDGCKIQELKSLNSLTGDFCIATLEHVDNALDAKEAKLKSKEQIKKLELRWSPSELSEECENSHNVLDFLQPCSSLEELEIVCYVDSVFPEWVRKPTFDLLVSISFYRCENVVEIPQIQQLPLLKRVEIVGMNRVRTIEWGGNPKQCMTAFGKLEKLEIEEMQSLEVWKWVEQKGYCESLVELCISNCPKLERLEFLPCLSSIEQLEIRECDNLELSVKELKTYDRLVIEDCSKITGVVEDEDEDEDEENDYEE